MPPPNPEPVLGLDDVRTPGCLLFECVSGSKAYGTDTPDSDTDLRGVFVAPRAVFYGLGEVTQVSDAKADETYYELARFAELLGKNNPNILELLYTPESCIRFRHQLFDKFRPEIVLSKLCEATFAGYALTQVRKARGLNKKIVNPMPEERKVPSDFCYVLDRQGSVPLAQWLDAQGLEAERCGLVNIPHMPDVYGIYHDPESATRYRGIFKDDDATEVRFSSVPHDAEPIGWMTYNRDAFKKHCRQHREYWDWVTDRNESRYQTNVDHGRNYDSKNLMHTFRLLEMATEIATEGRIEMPCAKVDFLMRIRRGEFEYDELVTLAEKRIEKIHDLYASSTLPDKPDDAAINEAVIEIRRAWYEMEGNAPSFP